MAIDWKRVVGTVAPPLATALGGPLAGLEGDQTSAKPVTVRVLGPAFATAREKFKGNVKDTRTRRIPIRRSEKEWAVELTGLVTVTEALLGASVEDLEHGN